MTDPQDVGGNGDTFHRTRELLAAYPFASATPSTHVARHLSNLSIAASPPSYVQPTYYSIPPNYGSVSAYQTEISQLAATHVPPTGSSERAYWDASRSDVFQLMADQSTSNYYAGPVSYWNALPAPSSYQAAPFAQSVMQHMVPYNAYPTPPPPSVTFSSSSSSLANALGSPTNNRMKRAQQETGIPKSSVTDSSRFFNDFLGERMKDLPKSTQRTISNLDPLPSTPRHEHSSPDPLQFGMQVSSPRTPLPPSQDSPKKRKLLEVLIESPSKRPSNGACSKNTLQTSSTGDAGAAVTTPRSSRMQVYVEITPAKDFTTPSRSRSERSGQNTDLWRYDSEDNVTNIQRHEGMVGVRSSGKRTGDRDDRVPLEKFLNLLEDIFEAEDNISPDTDINALPSTFFSRHSADPSRPLLQPTLIARLSKAISKISRPTKRTRLAPASWEGMDPKSPRKAGGIAEIEIQTLSRLLKLLERSVRASEDLDPFGSVLPVASCKKPDSVEGAVPSTKDSGPGPSKTVAESAEACLEPHDGDGRNPKDSGTYITGDAVGFTIEQVDNLERLLEVARDGVLAADCCVSLLTSDRLPKQLLSEELISSCLATIKNSLTRIVYPFVEAPTADARNFSPVLIHLTRHSLSNSQPHDFINHRRLIGDIFQTLTAVFTHINNLVCAHGLSMTESIIIPAVYIAIGPFFIAEGGADGDVKSKKDSIPSIIANTLGNSGMRGLRLEALSLIRSLFAFHEDQRSWIIEEILSSLVRLSDSKQKAGIFRLRDGRSIRTVSALLLQLVQTSAHGIRVGASRLAKSRQQQLALRRHDSLTGVIQERLLDEMDHEETSLYASGLEAPTKAAKAIVVFLTQRSGKGKSTKNSNELEYRTIFDNLISDLLLVLFRPEWPAASLVLSIICKYMITSLDDVKISGHDNNASKATALDHLGIIAGKLRANTLRWSKSGSGVKSDALAAGLKNIDKVVSDADKQGLDRLIAIHREVSAHLSKRSAEDHAYESARELDAVIWGQELAAALIQLNELLNSEDLGLEAKGKYLALGGRIKSALHDLWRDAPTDVFDNTTQEEIDRADNSSEQLGTTQTLANAFDPILNVILLALDAPPVFVRTKALRSLSQILTVDPTVLSNSNVRHAIESHLLDSSPQVRDAAVELIGKYMVEFPKVAEDYYQKIAERIADTGLGVRKRVIKLFRTFYYITDDFEHKVDICSRLVLRMLDEDDTVKESAIKALEELWFSTVPSGQAEKTVTITTASAIMGVCGVFKDRQAPLEDILRSIIAGKDGIDVTMTRRRFTQIYDTMIEGLIDAADFVNFTVVNCIRTIYLFTVAYPSVMSASKASVLLPYLKNSASNEDIVASDYILRIYRTSIPYMSKTSIKFGNELQSLLQPMVVKPNVHGSSLQEIVACLCSVVQHLTHEYARLVALLKSCIARVRQFIARSDKSLDLNDARALHLLVSIVSLLGEHFDFDRLRADAVEVSAQLDAVSKGSIIEHIYMCLLQLYEKYEDASTRGRLLVCLGFLFRARPTLMTLDSSATMMDAIFASSDEDSRGRLLKIMQDFLIAESNKHSAQQIGSSIRNSSNPSTGINMEELVGNTHGFAESGVSSAVVQRYLNQILDAALSPVSHIQASAVDILSFTVKQGLAHPLLSFPVIVSLETSPINSLSSRAVALHTVLHHKHTSLLNSGFISACRKSFDYQKKLLGSGRGQAELRGYRMQPTPTALLGRWYALVREKRAMRQEFLRSVLKVFEVGEDNKTDDDDVQFVRYMAENFASFDYRTQEEVLTVLKMLTRQLAETGALLVERVAPGNLLAQLRPIHGQDPKSTQTNGSPPSSMKYSEDSLPVDHDKERSSVLHSLPLEEQLAIMRSTCIIGMIMLLKSYLKNAYGLSEEKCQKFVIGKKSAIGDRPAVRRKDTAISWDRMPFASKPMRSTEDVELQRETLLVVWNEDGATVEPEGDEWE